jgi:hypothetical protein
MNKQLASISNLFIIIKSLNRKTKVRLSACLFLSIAAALAEMISLAALIPFLTVLFKVSEQSGKTDAPTGFLSQFALNFSLQTADRFQAILILTICFCLLVIIASSLRWISLDFSLKASAYIGSEMADLSYTNLMHKPYSELKATDSSIIITSLVRGTDGSVAAIEALLRLTNAALLVFFVSGFLIIYNIQTSIIIISITASFYGCATFLFARRIRKNSEISLRLFQKQLQILNQSFGSLKDLIISSK